MIWWLVLSLAVLFLGSFTTYAFASTTSVQTDKTIYFARDTIILEGTVERLVKDLDSVRLEFVNPNGKVIS